MATLRIATFNCAGLGMATRRKTVFDHLRSADVQLYCLQETHSTTLDEFSCAEEWGKTQALFHSNSKNDRSNGVVFLLNHPSLKLVNWYGDQHGRILSAELSTNTEKIRIINVYAPQSGFTTRERSRFFDSLYIYVHASSPTILTGDFNMVESSRLDRDPPSSRTDPTQSLQDLCSTFGLRYSLRLKYGNTRLFTRRQGSIQSRLDRFYMGTNITPAIEFTSPGISSDHDMVVLGINNIAIPERGRGRWKNNASTYADPLFQQHFQYKWRQWCTLQPFLFSTKIEWWIQIKSRIKSLLIEHAKTRLSTEKKHENNLRRSVEKLCQQVHENTTLLPLYHQVKTEWSKSKLEQTNAKAKKSKLDQFQNNDQGTKEFFQQFSQHRQQTTISRLRSPEGKTLINKNEILQETKRFYQSLYQKKAIHPEAQLPFLRLIHQSLDPNDDQLTRPITATEPHNTILQAASEKSPGPDGLTIELYKNNWTTIADDLTNVFNEVHGLTHIPSAMKLGSITLIHKKNSTELLTNYRPISLLNIDLKIYTKLLANRLKPLLFKVIHVQQYARPGSQIHHVLTMLRDMYQHSSNQRLEHFYLSLDFEKAFDSVDHQWLYQVLRRYGFPPKFINIVTALQSDASSEILVNGHRTQPFAIKRGVRQGDPLSLFLFLIAVEPFMTAIRHNNKIIGIRTTGRFEIKILCYADDITITVIKEESVKQIFFSHCNNSKMLRV